MADVQSLLAQALSAAATAPTGPIPMPAPSVSQQKQAEIAAASDEKKAELGVSPTAAIPQIDPYQAALSARTGKGAATRSEVERDYYAMDPYLFSRKYGAAGDQLAARMRDASEQVYMDRTRERAPGEAVWDTGTEVLSGAANSLAGIANWGLGLVDSKAGAEMAEVIGGANRFVQDHQSEALKAARRVAEAGTKLNERDNTALYEQDKANGSRPLIASLKRVGRDILSEADNSLDNPMVLAQGVANAAGSLIAGAPVTKGVKLLGEAVTLGKLGASANPVAQRIAKAGDWLAWPTATGLMEGGGAYQQTADQVMQMPFSDLERGSQAFRDAKASLIASGMAEDQANAKARIEVANNAALEAANIQAPAAAVTSLLARGSGENPFHKVGPAGLAKEMLGEGTEELLQSGSGQFAQNKGVQDFANADQSLTDGVGSQAAQGALAGGLSVGAFKGPGAVVQTGVDGARAAIGLAAKGVGAAATGLMERGDAKLQAEANKDSTVSDQAVQQKTDELIAQAPQVQAEVTRAVDASPAPEEAKIQAKDYASSLVQTFAFDPTTMQMDHLPDALKTALSGTTDRTRAIYEAARAMVKAENTTDRVRAAMAFNELVEPVTRFQSETDPKALAALPEDSEARLKLADYQGLMSKLTQSPAMSQALKTVDAMVKDGTIDQHLPEVTEASLKTPEGQQAVKDTIATVSQNPTAVAPEKVDAILRHADEGRIDLTPDQRRSLEVARDILRAHRDFLADTEAKGLTQAKDVVSGQIFTSTDPLRAKDGQPSSALQHVAKVRQAVQTGNTTLAQSRLADFGQFVQHMKNKVDALAEHYALNDPHAPAVPYMALMPETRDWKLSSGNGQALHKGMSVNTKSVRAVDFAQSVEAEQKMLAQVYNATVRAFPELGAKEITPSVLPDALHGKPEDVVQAHAHQRDAIETEDTQAPQGSRPASTPGTEAPAHIESAMSKPMQQKTRQKAADEGLFDVAGRGQQDLFSREAQAAAEPRSLGIPKAADPPISSFSDSARLKDHPDYANAKAGDRAAAIRFVSDIVDPVTITEAQRRFGEDAIYVPAAAEEASGRNAIPATMAAYYAEFAGGTVETDIIQTVRAHHTGAKPMERLISRPLFGGPVKSGGRYVLVDDVSTMGGTLAEMAHHIQANGGQVIGTITLANASREGQFSPTRLQVRTIEGRYGDAVRQLFGIAPTGLTADEARYILGFRDADSLRAAAAKAGDERNRRLGKAGVQGNAPDEGSADGSGNNTALAGADDGASGRRERGEPAETGEAGGRGRLQALRSGGTDGSAEPAPAGSGDGAGRDAEAPAVNPAPAAVTQVLFPNLLRRVPNMLDRAFKAPNTEEAPTRTLAQDKAPIPLVQEALQPSANLAPEISARYQELLAADGKAGWNLKGILEAMNASLATFLAKTTKDGKSNQDKLLEGVPVNRWVNGKALNILDEVDGKLVYNEYLQQSAALAALQWWLTGNHYTKELSTEDLASLTGLNEDDVLALSKTVTDNLSQGVGLDDAISTLARLVTQFWGLKPDAKADLAYSQGIPRSVAAELLQAMIKQKMVMVETVELDQRHGLDKPKTFDRYILPILSDDEPLRKYPTAIQDAVLTKPEEIVFLHQAVPPVAERQMNNPDVANTPEQKQALANEQQTPFRLNPTMVSVYEALGIDGVLSLFGAGDIDAQTLNVNHARSLEGKNRTIAAAFRHLGGLVEQVRYKASDLKVAPEEVDIRYAYNFSRVGRMQMLGAYNPQANKLVREAVLPTWRTLDLSAGGQHSLAFGLALAQALDIKVHKMSPEDAAAKAKALLSGPLAPAVELLSDVADRLDAKALKDAFDAAGVPVTPLALHAVSEHARYLKSSEQERKTFTTGLYLEADGVTNGPINAMALMSIDRFTPEWVKNMARGGVSFGGAKSMAELNRIDGTDLYGASAQATGKHLQRLSSVLRTQSPELSVHAAKLYDLMARVLPGMDFDPTKPDGEQVSLDRNIAKNPLTITIYGASAQGIAGKLASMVEEAIYERMSQAAQTKSIDPEFSALIDELTSRKVSFDKRSGTYSLVSVDTPKHGDPATFTLSPAEKVALKENLLHLFVQPMRDGIAEVVGEPLTKAVTKLRQATQAQSIVLEQLYKQAIDEAVAERKKSDPEFRDGDFLSKADLDGIMKKLAGVSPLVRAAGQAFLIAKSKKTAREDHPVGQGLDGTMRTAPEVYTPSNAGVAGIPFTTIGFGDGVMMLKLAQDTGVQNTLKIFDGMNMPLDRIGEYSQKANGAVYEAMLNNPLRAAEQTYARFMEHQALVAEALDREAREIADPAKRVFNLALVRALFEDAPRNKVASTAAIMGQLALLHGNLKWAANSVEARHKAMADVAMSVDHMAAAASPFTNAKAGAEAVELTPVQIAEQLNERYQVHLAAAKETVPEAPKASVQETKAEAPKAAPALSRLEQIGREDKASGVRLVSFTALKKLSRLATFTPAQKVILGEILRSLGTKEYTVVAGSEAQIAAFQKARGLTGAQEMQADAAGRVHGYVSVAERTVYLIDPTPETLVHELVHASTFEAVLAHYEGRDLGENAGLVRESVARLETMLDAFKNTTAELDLPLPVIEASEKALASITAAESRYGAATAMGKAAALNEFMAWGLTNEALTRELSQTKVHPLVKLARDVVATIKSFIWGRKKAPTVGEDALSNLQFHAGVLVRTQASLSGMLREATLYHASQGMSARNQALREALASKVVDMLEEAREGADLALKKELNGVADMASTITDEFAAHFPMSPGDHATFEMVVTALAMRAEFDTAALDRLQEVHTHVVKALSFTDFIDPTDPDRQRAEYYAMQKYNAVIGKTVRGTDPQGRSTLLPTFLGLAMVNDEFRQVLSRMDLPKAFAKGKTGAKTVDAHLESLGNQFMDWLSRWLAGEGKSTTVLAAVDRLADRLRVAAMDEQTLIAEMGSKAQGVSERLNQAMVTGLNTMADKTIALNRKAQGSTAPKLVKAMTGLSETLTRLASEKNADAVAIGVMDVASRAKLWKPVFDLINDAVGRTSENAGVYDMIKQVRAVAQQLRQQFREKVPEVIASKFSRPLSQEEWTALYRGLGKTDLAVLMTGADHKDTMEVLANPKALKAGIADLETQLQTITGQMWPAYQDKMQQLARFMMTGATKGNLLRNADAIAQLFDVAKPKGWTAPGPDTVKLIDKLTTLYAVQHLSADERKALSSLVQDEAAGVGFALNYLVGQRKTETAKAQGLARFNAYKGHLPSEPQKGLSLVVADDSKRAALRAQGYVRVADYTGSNIDGHRPSMGYYFAPMSGRAAFSQGIMQNVKRTAGGVDQATGQTSGLVAGRVVDRQLVADLVRKMGREQESMEALLPVRSETGQVIAFERAISPTELQRLKPTQHLAEMTGVWRGRQLEEELAQSSNAELIDRLHEMWQRDLKTNPSNRAKYINLFDAKNSPIIKDAVSLFSPETLDHIKDTFGDEFWVRKDLVDDSLGYRMASVRDLFNDNSPLSKNAQDNMKRALVGLFGVNVYRRMIQGEQVVQGVMANLRTRIVVQSVIVPAYNFASNMVQLAMRGVPWSAIGHGSLVKLTEIHSYAKTKLRQIELEAELRAAGNDPIRERRLQTEIQAITDAHQRLSIWPLIAAGEFSTVSDVGMTVEDLDITSGDVAGFMRKQLDKLPDGLKAAARYGLVTRDTALFAGLQRAVQYGDFIAKAVLYDDLVKRRKMAPADALARITEEFVNYDRLPGRSRSYLESMGLLWFYNYKIRIAKVAASMIRENPLHALLGSGMPLPSGVGTPLGDNMLSKLAEGTLPWSMGPAMAFRGLHMNPWWNLAT